MGKYYSVLMAVYYKDNVDFFKYAVDSMLNQTIKTNDFVLVCDGELSDELNAAIDSYTDKFPEIFHVIRLKKHQGLGNALREGVLACSNELIARMDSDDFSEPNRIELQLKEFSDDPKLSVCGGQIAEFEKDIDQITGIRAVPCSELKIRKFAKARNPVNHMTVMFKKADVIEAGNYIELNLAEDYYLWVRMLCENKKFKNIAQVLVYVRTGNGMYQRRGGLQYVGKMILVQKKMLELKFISFHEFIFNILLRSTAALLPSNVRGSVYKHKLRKNHNIIE
ncbi:glycosyltransferase [Clostridium porci]|uniref:Glycosyltransferase n=1 Tax=Clostridium porci TaxID=2605778 RepID=A0A7X2NM13_9CLOT|nr:glycosyltransferase [Clostridium porci]MSS36808.1 glycosyltransferase [Clostridium porci]